MNVSLCVCLLLLITMATIGRGSRNEKKNKMLYIERHNSNENNPSSILLVTWSPENREEIDGCQYFEDQNPTKQAQNTVPNAQTRLVTQKEMELILEDCTKVTMKRKRQTAGYSYYTRNKEPYSNRKRKSNPTNSQINEVTLTTTEKSPNDQEYRISGIWPGTKWCGAGNVAESFDDLGIHIETDKCCRAHDFCNDTIAPDETKYNLTNDLFTTKSNCQCDDEFYDCLSRVDSFTSNTVGEIYFNILEMNCFKYDYPPPKKCKKYRSLLRITCEEYEEDTTSSKAYHWVSAKPYTKPPVYDPDSASFDL